MTVVVHRPTELAPPPETGQLFGEGESHLFLAGPIMGAKDWQEIAIEDARLLVPADRTLHISNPRWTALNEQTGKLHPNDQRTWEKRHYRDAAYLGAVGLGVVAFWVPAESPTAPVRNRPGRAYGQGTRVEFAELMGMRQMAPYPVQVVLGIDPTFEGGGLHEYFHTAKEFGIPVHESLSTVVRTAVSLVMR